MDFTRICRICLQSNKQSFDIYRSYYSKKDMLYCEMLSSCTKIKPNINDGFPRLICKDCSRQLRRTYVFNLLCEKSESKLKEYIDCNKLIQSQDDVDFKDEIFDAISTPVSNVANKNQNVFENTMKGDVITKDECKPESDQIYPYVQKEVKDEEIETIVKVTNIPNISDEIKIDMYKRWTNENIEESYWDEDDNEFLLDVKKKKSVELTNGEKKKRGRRKKVYTEGETPQKPDSKLPHQCDVCGKILSNKSNLKAHKICHTELRPYKCGECSATFRGHSALFQHRKTHTGETPYHCEYCPKQFGRRTNLVNHIRMHTGEKLFSCDICFKDFVQSAQLSIHMKRHKGDKTYLCQDCGKGFPIKADLKVHQRIHNGEKPYACHLCTKTFATSGNLSIHVRIHNKDVRYNCKLCHRGFVTRSAFNVHVKRHKGQRDYHCECGKTFYTSSALKQHKVVHTGEKRYQCKICERKFTQTSHLSRHFKRDHMKPNAPMPSSDHYKTVLQDGVNVFKNVLTLQLK